MAIKSGNSKLFVEQKGQGWPAVVFEAGMGEDHSTWQDVQPEIARLTSTLSYDRAGLGQSESSDLPRTVAQLAKELHRLLHALKLAGPFVLVGHSLGGNIITLFANLFPDDTAGLIFVDTGFDEQRLKLAVTAEEWAARESALQKYLPVFSPGQQMEKDSLDESCIQVGKARPLPNVPAVILSGTLINPDFPISDVEREVKLKTHEELMAALPQAEQVIVPEARHYLQNETPPVVIDAVKRVILKVRNTSSK